MVEEGEMEEKLSVVKVALEKVALEKVAGEVSIEE